MESTHRSLGGKADEAGRKARIASAELPVAFGVYDEGGGLYSASMTPFHPRTLARALASLDLDGTFVDATPGWTDSEPRIVHLVELERRSSPLELVHCPPGDVLSETVTIMAAPHEVLPGRSERRLALSLQDWHHAVLYSREPALIGSVLGAWLKERIGTLAEMDVSPDILDATMASVLDPLPPQAWRHLLLDRSHRYWSLDLSARVADDVGVETPLDETRWVGGPDRAWRAGWSW